MEDQSELQVSAVCLQAEFTLPAPKPLPLAFCLYLAADGGPDGKSHMEQHHPFLDAEGICSSRLKQQQSENCAAYTSLLRVPPECRHSTRRRFALPADIPTFHGAYSMFHLPWEPQPGFVTWYFQRDEVWGGFPSCWVQAEQAIHWWLQHELVTHQQPQIGTPSLALLRPPLPSTKPGKQTCSFPNFAIP